MVIQLSTRAFLAAMLAVAMETPATYAQSQATSPCQATDSADKTSKAAPADQSSAKKADKTSTPCAQEPAKDLPAAQKFPFPGETPLPPMPGSTTSVPDSPAPPLHRPSAAEEHPVPGSAPPMPGSDSSSSSSSSSDGSSSSAGDSTAPETGSPPLDDRGDNPRASTRRRLPKVKKLQSDEDRAAEDLTVAKFYEQSGDLNAAYLRTKDAVKYQPSEPEAHYALAQMAQKLNKRDEAIAEYNAYLQLAPDGLQIKQAHKALDQLQR